MIEIVAKEPNRKELHQWDVGRFVELSGIDADKVHFANKGDSKAPILDIVDSKAKIPDYLLQTGKQLCVYAVKDGVTIESYIFYVAPRERPENYVYEEDRRNYIYELIQEAENSIAVANQAVENVAQAVESANIAVASANQATMDAKSAVDRADSATSNANTAASIADIAAGNANESSNNANLAAENASSAASIATQAATNANGAAASASLAANNANEAVSNANRAAANANEAANDIAKQKFVKTVNGIAPDENGNVEVQFGGGGLYDFDVGASPLRSMRRK